MSGSQNQQDQKDAARALSLKNNVGHTFERDVYSDASGQPTAKEYEMPDSSGYIREEMKR